LDIPIEGLNYYTSATFASRLAKQQPLNIEADSELGMPIDLVGIPGIFNEEEDESGTLLYNIRLCISSIN
jgi:RNA polymerase II-associated factor 1